MGETGPFLAKITGPQPTRVLPRPRLFRRLDRARRRPIIWVAGPPGAGKTTLVASYLERRKLRALWYYLDEGDSDIGSFFHFMGQAAKRIAPARRRPLPHLSPEYLSSLFAFTRRFFEELYARLRRPCVVVFDNYQDVPSDAPLHQAIPQGLMQVPSGIHVVIISRENPPPAFARLLASQAVEVMDGEALKLTPGELRGVLRQQKGPRLSQDGMRLIQDRLDGWMAGVVLVLEQMRRKGLAPAAFESEALQGVFDYFAGEIFDKMTRAVRDFLLKTALFPRMTDRMAQQLTGLSRAGRILSDLHRRHFFTERQAGSGMYEYHALFREFLLARARETFSPAELMRLQRRAATVLENAGQVEETIGLFCEAGDWAAVSKLILQQAPSMIAQGRYQMLEGWLRRLPEAMVRETPWLLYWRGLCRLPFDPGQSRSHFAQAFEWFLKQGDDPAGIFLSWSGVIETFVYQWGDWQPVDRWIALLEERLRAHPEFPSREIEARVATLMALALELRQPQHPKIRLWVERALQLARSVTDPTLRMQALNCTAQYYSWIHDQTQLGIILNLLRKVAESAETSPPERITYYVWEAVHHWFSASKEDCLQAVNSALEIAERSGVHLLDHHVLSQGVYGSLSTGDLEKGAEFLKRMTPLMQESQTLMVSHYHFLTAWEAWLRDDQSKALESARTALDLAVQSGAPFPEACCRLGLVQVLLKHRAYSEAKEHLAHALSIIRGIGSRILEYMALLAEVRLRLAQGREEDALHSLRRAMRLGREHGYINAPWWDAPALARLCAKALERGIEVDYVRDLIRKRRLVPEEPPLEIESWPWPLKLYTLGRFALVQDGAPLRLPAKTRLKPLMLLKALVALGGRGVAEAELADLLWPESLGDAAHRALITTLQRLRQMLGYKEALEFKDGRLAFDARYVWIDCWAFEHLLAQAEAADGRGRPEQGCAWRMRALGLYQGAFLPEEVDAVWAVSLRERLRNKYLRQLERLGQHWEQKGDWRQAVECYLKGLEVDDLAEVFYQRLMVAYQRLGRRTDAIAVYQRCRATLSAKLGTAPAAATDSLYRQLTRG